MYRALFFLMALTLASTVLGTGCNLKKDQQTVEKEKAAAAATVADESEKHKLDAVRAEFKDRAKLYENVAGVYEGYYLAPDGMRVNLLLTLSVVGGAYDPEINKSMRESELAARVEGVSLAVELKESLPNSRHKLFTCSLLGIKPDFQSGLIRLNCPGQYNGGSRNYLLAFERGTDDAYDDEPIEKPTLQELQTKARPVASDLSANRIRSVEEFNLVITTPESDFSGKLWHKQ